MRTLSQSARELAAGTSSRSLVEECLARIADPAGEGRRVFLKVHADTARASADYIEHLRGFPGIGGVITVHPGNRIPLIPKQTGKAFVDIRATSKFVINLGLIANSSMYARGNENNAYQADGVYYLGPGVSPGYAIVNFAAHYDLTRRLQLAVQVDNVLNHHYYTAAQIENTPFTTSGTLIFQPFPAYATGPQAGNLPLQSATFFAPGAPIRAWVELKLKF